MQKFHLYYKELPWHDPEKVFLSLYTDKKYTFWLDNNSSNSITSRFSYMGKASQTIKYTHSDNILSISNNNITQKFNQDIFAYLKKQISAINHQSSVISHHLPFDFTGGFVGCLSYEKSADFLYIDKFLAFDHRNKKVYLICLSKDKNQAQHWFSTTETLLSKPIPKMENVEPKRNPAMREKLSARGGSAFGGEIGNPLLFSLSRSHQQYLKDIKTCQNYLLSGDAYQICLTNQVTTKLKINWLKLYLTLRKANPSPFNAFLDFGNFALLSSSPEQFLQIDKNRIISSKPMKGTLRRGKTTQEDIELSKQLGKNEKDFAENMMIVDLVRSDLGKVCAIGSIQVESPLTVETYATVHQLVTTIKGKLKKEMTVIDALIAAFPGGSMTGAPKIRAMQILSEIEKQPRGIYSGCFGYLSLNDTANLAMTIRTIIATKDKLTFGTGGAILTDSIPEMEYKEMLLKTQALIEAIMKTTVAKRYKIFSKTKP